MTVKRIIIQTCHLIVLLNFTHTYVLFAANLDDFRSIAKKFIPNKLADQLTAMAAQNSAKYKQQMKSKQDNTQSYAYSTSDETNERAPKPVKQVLTTPKKRFAIKDQVDNINFDELVDRVRQQLEDKYKSKPKSKPNKVYHKDNEESEEKNIRHDEIKQTSKKIMVLMKTTTENTQMYYDYEGKQENDGTYFKEDDLTKTKDSYEDYVTPNKNKIFESDAETVTEKENTRVSEKARYKDQKLKAVAMDTPLTEDQDQDYDEHKSEEVKAQTGSILDDPDKTGKPKKLKGTMIPTREYFKMSSPTYAVSAIAEKYDFNEPLPERDREPEDLKHFVNPPATINKKVRLTGID